MQPLKRREPAKWAGGLETAASTEEVNASIEEMTSIAQSLAQTAHNL